MLINILKRNSQVFCHRFVVTNRLLVSEHFGADIIMLIITSLKRIVTVFASPFLVNFENSALMLIQLLFGLVFSSSLKVFGMQLTQVHAAKDVAE